MPRKVKQKQKQRQTQKQTVIVKLEQPKKVKRERRKRVKKVLQEGDDDFQKYNPYFRQLPPPTIIQSFPQVPAQAQAQAPLFNPPQQMQFINAPPRQIPFLEDIGLVGSSEILDVPTKEEQLSEMMTPVSDLSQFNPQFEPQPLALMKPSIESFNPLEAETLSVTEQIPVRKEKKIKRNSLKDLNNRYYNLTGEQFVRQKGFTVKEFKKLVEKMEQV